MQIKITNILRFFMSIGVRFKEAVDLIRIKEALTQPLICEKIGISTSSLSQYAAQLTNPRPTTVRKLADAFGVSYDYIMTGKGKVYESDRNETKVLPNLENIAEIELYENPVYANTATVIPISDYMVGKKKFLFKHPITNPADYASLTVSGNSMKFEGILDGDTVIFKKSDNATDNNLVVVRLNGMLLVKIYKEINGSFELHSNDGVTKPLLMEVDDNCEIIGIVISTIREY